MARFRKTGTTEMRPYVCGEDLKGISVSDVDKVVLKGDNPGGMIATGDTPDDQWYVDQKYFDAHYEECRQIVAGPTAAEVEAAEKLGWQTDSAIAS